MPNDFTPLAAGLYLEGLAVGDGAVWFSDVIGGGVHRVGADGTIDRWLTDLRWIASIMLDEDGTVLCTGPGGIHWLDPASGRTGMVVDTLDGRPLDAVNELCADPHGGLYFGTVDLPAIQRGERPGPVGIHHRAPDGTVRQVCDGLVFCNGMTLSADGRRFFHNESFVGTFSYPVRDDGTFGERTMILDKPDCDGIALDVEGNLWITGFNSQDVLCLSPEGEVLDRVTVPSGTVTNARFGDDGDLYVNAVPAGAGDDLSAGRQPTSRDSVLYRTTSPVPGRPAARCRLGLDHDQAGSE